MSAAKLVNGTACGGDAAPLTSRGSVQLAAAGIAVGGGQIWTHFLDREHELRHIRNLVGDTVQGGPVFDYQRTHGATAHLQRGRAVVVGVIPECPSGVVTRDGVDV